MSFVKATLKNLSNDQEIEITKDKFTVGRSLQADYVLNSLAVSRIHFTIEKKDGTWTIKDNSTNGTLINDSLLKSTSRSLTGDDLIKIRGGSVIMKFTVNNPVPSFITTSTAPLGDFIVSTINGDNLPSVSNDHCYERRAEEEARTAAEGFAVSPVSHASSPNTSDPPETSNPSNLKRDRTPEVEESSKKNKTEEQPSSNSDNFREELECSICQELFIKAVTLNCSHTFCNSCILKWRNQRNYCPICREPIKNISPSIVLDNIIEKVVCTLDQETRKQREEQVQERLKIISTLKPSSGPTCYYTSLNAQFDGAAPPLIYPNLDIISVIDSPPDLISDSDESDFSDWSEPEEEEEYAGGLMDLILDMEEDAYENIFDYEY